MFILSLVCNLKALPIGIHQLYLGIFIFHLKKMPKYPISLIPESETIKSIHRTVFGSLELHDPVSGRLIAAS